MNDRSVSTWRGRVLTWATFKRRDVFSVEIKFTDDSGVVLLGAGATGVLALKSDFADNSFLAISRDLVAPETVDTPYSFEVDLNTQELEAKFSQEPARIASLLEIRWIVDGKIKSCMPLRVIIGNDLIRGDEGEPTPATAVTPIVQFIDDRPEHKTDFFMFPGGVAPATGLYQAADANYIYTFKGGWTQWRRSPIAAW